MQLASVAKIGKKWSTRGFNVTKWRKSETKISSWSWQQQALPLCKGSHMFSGQEKITIRNVRCCVCWPLNTDRNIESNLPEGRRLKVLEGLTCGDLALCMGQVDMAAGVCHRGVLCIWWMRRQAGVSKGPYNPPPHRSSFICALLPKAPRTFSKSTSI